MNINCIICSDLFISSDSIVTAGCGHCFHFHCLTQWLERSKTCPQCRSRCTQRNTIRIFLNILTNADLAEDAGTLINKVDTLTLQAREKDEKIGGLKREIDKRKEEVNKYARTIMALEKSVKTTEALVYAHKEEVKLLRTENTHLHQLQSENKELKQKVEVMKTVEDVLSATAAEVEEIIKNESDPRVLGVLVASLKRELKHSNAKKAMLLQSMKLTQSDHRRELDSRKKLEEKCSHLESENYRLEQELYKLLNSSPTSPVNPQLKSLLGDSVSNEFSTRLLLESQPKSDSPYLNLKASNVGLSPLLNRRKNDKASAVQRRDDSDTLASQFTIFKKPRLTIKNTTVRPTLSSDMAFDGLGGTSKKENMDFPTPISTSNILSTTTSHSLKRIPSAKFKKLTKNPSLGNMDKFLAKN